MASKANSGFAYLKKDRQLPAVEDSPTAISDPQPLAPAPAVVLPADVSTSSREHVETPIRVDAATPASITQSVRSASPTPSKAERVKFTTAIRPALRDDVDFEIRKMAREGKSRMSMADLIEHLLTDWLKERRIS